MKCTAVVAAFFVALIAGASAQAAELPEAIKQAGVLNLTVSATYAPMEYRDPATNELVGLDIDLGTEIAKRLSLKAVFSETKFAEIIPALQTKRADMIISGLSDRPSRRETADFVDYLKTGPQFFVLADSAAQASLDLCGKKVGTTRSTIYPLDIERWSKANCEAAGKPAIVFGPGETAVDVRNQLKQGRIDAAVQGSETLPYALKQEPGKYRVVGEPIGSGYQGMMFRKEDVALREVVTAAFAAMIKDGTYKTILTKWGLAEHAVAEPLLNAGTP